MENKLNKYKYKIIRNGLNKIYTYKYNKYLQIGGDREKYKKFLLNILQNITTCYTQQIGNTTFCNFTQTLCSCDNKLKIIKLIAKASNSVYLCEILNDCDYESVFLEKSSAKVAVKFCDLDEFTCSIANEVINMLKYSMFAINNICSNYLYFFGYVNKCKNIFVNNQEYFSATDTDDISCTISEYIDGETLDSFVVSNKKLSIRQIFEYMYSVLCSLICLGYFIDDIHPDNIMVCDSKQKSIIEIYDKYYIFDDTNTIKIIDYQTIGKTTLINVIINIKNFIDNSFYEKIIEYLRIYVNEEEQLKNLNILFPDNYKEKITDGMLETTPSIIKFDKIIL